MKWRHARSFLAATLAATVCFTGFNFTPILQARQVEAAQAVEEERLEETKVELEEERTETSTTFQREDGLKEVVIYSDAVRYEDEEGKLVDYDASLTEVTEAKSVQENSLKGYAYENTEGDRKNYIPEKLEEQTPLLLEHEDKSIEIAPDLDGETSAFTENGTFQKADEITEKVEDLYENEREETTGVSYLTKDEAMELQYISCKDGVKENIILNENPESPVFRYHVDLKGLTPQVNTQTGNIDLYEKDAKEPSAYIQAPYMEDASGENYSEDASYALEKEADGSWTLTLTVDADYLAYAQYPVTIDPTTTWRSNPSLRDAYVIKGSKYGSTNFYDSGITAMSVGKATQGYSRTFLKVDDLTKTIKGYNVVSAAFYFYENGSNATSNTVQVRPVSEDWAIKSVTWNNQPDYGGAVGSAKTNGVNGHELKMDVTGWCRKIATGASTNNGVVLRNADEGSEKYTKLYGTRHATTAKTPKLVIKYVDGPTEAAKVSASPTYVKKGGNVKLTWEGINSSYLDYVQYRVANSKGENVVNYSADTKIGSVSKASGTVATGSWADGTYRYYIRGVDTGGIKGTGKGVNVVVDSTAPKINSASFTVTTSSGKYSAEVPKLKWSVSDTNFKCIQYHVDGMAKDTYKTLSTAASNSTGASLDKSLFQDAKAYTVQLRAVDKAGNVSQVKTLTYYYDDSKPGNLKLKLNGHGSDFTGNTNVLKLSWTVSESHMSEFCYKVGNGAYKSVSGSASQTITLDKSLFPKDGTYKITVYAKDSAGNKSDVAAISYTLDTAAPTAESVSRSEEENGIAVHLYGISEELDADQILYAVTTETAKNPEQGAYEKAEDFAYDGDDLTVRIPWDETLEQEGGYRICVALADVAGNISYDDPAEAAYYQMDGAVYDGTLNLDAEKWSGEEKVSEPEEKWYLEWSSQNDADIIKNADIYESIDGSIFQKIATSDTSKEEMNLTKMKKYASYRIVATYQDGKKRLSNIYTLEKTLVDEYLEEQSQENGSTQSKNRSLLSFEGIALDEDYVYTEIEKDSDGDGLEDGYESWELGSDIKSKDSDGDGFDDYYEVTVLGTNPGVITKDEDSDNDKLLNSEEMKKGTDPYFPDSDFDGIIDSEDATPLETNAGKKSQNVSRAVHQNPYEQQIEQNSTDEKLIIHYNPYSKLVTGKEYVQSETKKIIEYYVYNKENKKISQVTCYESGMFNVINNTYDAEGNPARISYNGLVYDIERDENGNFVSISIDGNNILKNTYDGDGESVYQSQIKYANSQGEDYEIENITKTDEDGNTYKEAVVKSIKVDGVCAYEYEYDEKGRIQYLIDHMNDVTYEYKYNSDDEIISVTSSNGFQILKEDGFSDDTDGESRKYSFGENDSYSITFNTSEEEGISKQNSIIDNDINVENSYSETSDGGTKTVCYKGIDVLKQQQEENDKKMVFTTNNKKYQYVYDDAGNIIEISDMSDQGTFSQKSKYEYNSQNELISESLPENGIKQQFSYDENGNRTQKIQSDLNGNVNAQIQYIYQGRWRDVLSGYIINGKQTNILSNEIGNPLNWINGWEFSWSNGRSLKSASNDRYRINYRYNINGLRTFKQVIDTTTKQEVTSDYIWDGNCLVRETRQSANEKQIIDYLYDGTYQIVGFKLHKNDGTTATYLYERDYQGNVIAIYELKGDNVSCVAEYSYDAFGEKVEVKNKTEEKIGDLNKIRYRGYYQDTETSFYYLQSRYYDASAGRFLNVDSVLYMGLNEDIYSNEYHLFTYCNNDPVNYVDANGYKAKKPTLKDVKNFFKKYLGYNYKDGETGARIWYWGDKSPQSMAGYGDIYDDCSWAAGCNIDKLKLIFTSNKKEWRYELWKGSYAYGLAYGGEIGIYYKRGKGLVNYKCALDYPLKMKFILRKKGKNKPDKTLFTTDRRDTWWQTGFVLGHHKKNTLKMTAVFYFGSAKKGAAKRDDLYSVISEKYEEGKKKRKEGKEEYDKDNITWCKNDKKDNTVSFVWEGSR